MVWFRIDDVFPFHERVIRAGNAAVGLWSRAGAWSAGQLTDGFVPADVARTMGSAREIRRLVEVGLWLEEDGGYRFHAWAEDGTGTKRQPTRAEVEERRRTETKRKAAYRERQVRDDESGRYVPPSVPAGQTAGLPPSVPPSVPGGVPPLPARPDPIPPLTPFEGGASAPTPTVNIPVERPSPFCPKHPTGTDGACRACGNARRRHDAWTPPPPPARAPAWNPETHCQHGQLRGACDACEQEAREAFRVITGPWGVA